MTFELYWSDLSFDKQQSLINELKESFIEEAKSEAKIFMSNPTESFKDAAWQKIYCRLYAIDSDMEDDPEYNWEDALDEHLNTKAEDQLSSKIRGIEISV